MTDFDVLQTSVQSQIDLGTPKGNFALKTYFFLSKKFQTYNLLFWGETCNIRMKFARREFG